MRRLLICTLALTACGDDTGAGRLPDAAPVTDSQAQAVTLTVTRNGAPVAGVRAYFLNADSSVVASLDTDATGTASAVMAAGGSVTAINPFPRISPQVLAHNELRTFAAVKPGDHLTLTQDDGPLVTVTLKAPTQTNPVASSYEVSTSCGSDSLAPPGGSGGPPSPQGQITLHGCNGSADMLVVTKNADGAPISWLYHPRVPVTEGATIDFTKDTYQAVKDVTYTYMHPPEGGLRLQHSIASARRPMFAATFDPGSTLTVAEPVVPGATSIVDTSVTFNNDHHVLDWSAPSTSYTLDLAGVFLAEVLDFPSYDVATRRTTWRENTTGVKADLTVTGIFVIRGQNSWNWRIAAPHTAGTLTFPTLPKDQWDWTPNATDNVEVTDLLNAKINDGSNAQLPSGYDAVRAQVYDEAFPFVVGAQGRAVYLHVERPV